MRAGWIVVVVLLLSSGSHALAQKRDKVVIMSETLLQVTPNAAPITLDPQVTDTVNFTVKNLNYTGEELVEFTCGHTGAITSCNSLTAFAFMAKGATRTVKVVVTTGTGGTGTVTLTASVPEGSATGSYVATIAAESPVLDVSMNPGTQLARAACVTADAGPGAAFQCGELIATHSMPAFRSLDRQRSLTLLYNSGTASPHVAVMANYALKSSADSLLVELTVLDEAGEVGATAQRRYTTAGFQVNGPPRRLSIGANVALPTGVYRYKLVVTRMSGSMPRDSIFGEAIVVDRTQSPFGAGWALVGASELRTVRNDARLVVDADGSAADYEKSGSLWIAPAGAHRDTLFYSYVSDGAVPAAYYYWRLDLDRTRTFYDAAGKQIYVVDKAGRKSEYLYDAQSRVYAIRIGPYEEDIRYTVGYNDNSQSNGLAGRHVLFTDPAGRSMTVNIDPAGDAIEMIDPSVVVGGGLNQSLRFSYGGHRILQRTSRLGLQTIFGYLGSAPFLGKANVQEQPQAAGLLWWYEPIQLRGYPGSIPDVGWGGGGGGGSTQSVQAPIVMSFDGQIQGKSPNGGGGITPMNVPQGLQRTIHLDSATLWIDGPDFSGDASHFWVNAHGAPTRIRNPYGKFTEITYDATHTLLPIRVRTPMGAVTRARYDGLARLVWSEDSTHSAGRDSVTYAYGSASAPHLPTMISSPSANGGPRVPQLTTYNSLGLPDTIFDAAGNKTTLDYNTRAQLARVTTHSVKTELARTPTNLIQELIYETAALPATQTANGKRTYNLRGTKAPSLLLTTYDYDLFGNLRRVVLPSGDSTVTAYNARNALVQTSQYDGNTSYTTTDDVNADGLLLKRTDPRGVTREFLYDGLGRETFMRDELGRYGFKYYENGLGVTRTVSRHADTVRTKYDLLGRISHKILSEVKYTALDGMNVYGTPDGSYGSNPGDVLALSDSITYEYDDDGRMRRVDNRYSTITRTYYPEGGLASDQQYHKWNGVSTTLQYTYNRAGLRQTVTGSGRSYTYGYNSANQLSSIAISTGGSVGFALDEMNRLITVNYPTGHAVQHYFTVDGLARQVAAPNRTLTYAAYDNAGHLRELQISGDSARTEYFDYDGRGQMKRTYNTLGTELNYLYDASGNRTHEYRCAVGCSYYTRYTILPTSNRLQSWERYVAGAIEHQGNYYLNINGEQTRATTSDGNSVDPYHRKYSHYNALGQYVGDLNTVGRQWDRFGSDGLGRRVKGAWNDIMASTFYDGDDVVKFVAEGQSADYLQGPGIDAPVIEYLTGGAPCYYATTGNRLISYFQASGVKCTSERWQSHGQAGGAIANSYSFGLSRNSDSGVSYFRNRLYDSNTGRFTSEDPIGFAGGMNLYGYTGNNPATYTDPFGLCPWCIGGAGGVATGYVLAKLTGSEYDLKDAAVDFALGAAGAGIVSKLDKINDARKGLRATAHGADRLADASRLGHNAAQEVIDNATRRLTQSDGAKVFVQEIDGRFNVVVTGERGVITNFKNLSERSLNRLARNYGWQ